MKMANPPHPGELILVALNGESVTEAARCMGISRCSLSRVINGKAAVSADMAYRLCKYLGSTTDIWLNLQTQYDVWLVENRPEQPKIIPRSAVSTQSTMK
ncbi:MAG: HigA family addiction module antidote protein [Burkholderiaceae bacterium]|nr:HigA family addiction module antidote protein [Burkholderiaceae bacterium]